MDINMELVSNLIVYLIVIAAVVGGCASILKPESELGKQFLSGINTMGELFIPIAGIMASLPLLSTFILKFIGPVFTMLGSDSAIAANTFIAIDLGGYPLAQAVASSNEAFVIATVVGYMAGAAIIFTLPVALQIVPKKFYEELSLGTMIGFLTIPLGVIISMVMIWLTNPEVRTVVSTTNTGQEVQLSLNFLMILTNLIPLFIICFAMAIGLYKIPNKMIKAFELFGKAIDVYTKMIVIIVIVQMFTGFLSFIPLDPVVADIIDLNRALEVAGNIALMLAGAFPLVYLIQKYLSKPLDKIGSKFGLSSDLTSGVLASCANVVAALNMIGDSMSKIDMVSIIAFSVCGAFLIGDHLAFSANFHPTLLLPIMVGKLVAGLVAIMIVRIFFKRTLDKKEINNVK